jgi:hypothetical protein
MRLIFALPLPLLMAAGCNVESDPQNDEVTFQYNQEAASQAVDDAGNTAEGIGAAIANEADRTADRIDNSGIVADGDGNTAQNRQ